MNLRDARRKMVEGQVRTNDVTDLRLQAAIEKTPREIFLPEDLRAQAYVEHDIAYAPGRRLLVARDFAKLLAAADPKSSDLVLDVACGSGYSSAVLAALAEMVVGVERDEGLAARAQANLSELGAVNSAVIVGDPAQGAPEQGPFDLIFIGGAIAVEPTTLLAQLKDGGRLAAIRRENGVSRGVVWRKDGAVAAREVFDAAAAHALPEFQPPKRFVF